MSKKQKIDKQGVITRTLNFDNISTASENSNLKKEDKKPKTKLVPIKFKVHKDLIEKFHILRLEYAQENKNFGLSNNEMFSIMVNFMYENFKKKNIIQDCPDDFKEAIVKPGKRKATSRTASSENSDSIIFTIYESVGDKYMDIMFSYIKNDKNDSVFNPHHTRTYFFYDFIDFAITHKKELINFKD